MKREISPSRRAVRSIIVVTAALITILPARSQGSKKYWVYFTDKGPSVSHAGAIASSSASYREAMQYLSPRAIARRSKVLPPDRIIDVQDIQLFQPYIKNILDAGGVPGQQCRWMNAASFLLTPDQLSAVQKFSFVMQVAPVVRFYGKRMESKTPARLPAFAKPATLNYGPSATQLNTINIPPLHDLGVTGHDVLVGMLDSGFRWRVHEALRTRHVIAEHDYVQNDDTTANQPCDGMHLPCDASNQDMHGTLTMSTLGGYMPGQLIGPAFDSDFMLAKTEYVPGGNLDNHWEEDDWAAGIEWMEANGADVVSSSLGYNTFVDNVNYTWAHGDFNGRTAVTSLAAVKAARLGVVVCDAMGNEGNGNDTTGTMLAPADADSIISVGAVDYAKNLAGFSSTGPTNDGRTKPDVVSPGVGVWCASTSGPSNYFSVSGTSLATPLTAGSAALMLSARPELTPIQVRDALRASAERLIDSARFPVSPNNFTGWGLINAFSAALSFGPIFANAPSVSIIDTTSVVAINVASKFGLNPAEVEIHFAIGSSSSYDSLAMALDSTMFFPTSGRYKATLPRETVGTLVKFYVTAIDSAMQSYQSPASVLGKVWQLAYGTTDVKPMVLTPKGYALLQNYPNPFNPATHITYDLLRREHVTIVVYNVLGEKVATLVDEVVDAGTSHSRPPVVFDGAQLPSGVYFYRIVTPSFSATKKMLLLR